MDGSPAGAPDFESVVPVGAGHGCDHCGWAQAPGPRAGAVRLEADWEDRPSRPGPGLLSGSSTGPAGGPGRPGGAGLAAGGPRPGPGMSQRLRLGVDAAPLTCVRPCSIRAAGAGSRPGLLTEATLHPTRSPREWESRTLHSSWAWYGKGRIRVACELNGRRVALAALGAPSGMTGSKGVVAATWQCTPSGINGRREALKETPRPPVPPASGVARM